MQSSGSSGQPWRYPHLAPELLTLRGDALHLWGDADERRRALEAILAASAVDDQVLEAAIERVDRAVREGLRSLGLSRGPVRRVRIVETPGLWAGYKAPDCTIYLAADAMRVTVRERGRANSAFRTWVHESLHARQPLAAGYRAEYHRYTGFEEGLVEGLARLIVGEKARVTLLEGSFEYYVQAYRTLASVITGEAQSLWEELWKHPPGQVRAAFPEVAAALHHRWTGHALTSDQVARLQGVADQVFSASRRTTVPNESSLVRVWETVIR